MFKGRTLLIATKHEKEKVIAPIFEKELGVMCIISSTFDTDELGTFTGEVERKDDPVTTARNKCLLAMELANCDMAVASEGSFGAHPSIYFVPADEEFLLFIDRKNELEIIVRELSTETNFNSSEIKSEKELIGFANAVHFPSHGLIFRKHKEEYSKIKKGITDWDTLLDAYHQFSKTDGIAYVETDMRAMYNPTRMKVIEKATIKLLQKINSLCPVCYWPGFEVTDWVKGLLCENCFKPTQLVLKHIYTCKKCSYKNEIDYPGGNIYCEAQYCDFCNP